MPRRQFCREQISSAGAVELRNAVMSKFNLDLLATVTFDYPTISALSNYIASKLATAMTGMPLSVVHKGATAVATGTLPGQPGKAVTEIVGISSSVATSGIRDKGTCSFLLHKTASPFLKEGKKEPSQQTKLFLPLSNSVQISSRFCSSAAHVLLPRSHSSMDDGPLSIGRYEPLYRLCIQHAQSCRCSGGSAH